MARFVPLRRVSFESQATFFNWYYQQSDSYIDEAMLLKCMKILGLKIRVLSRSALVKSVRLGILGCHLTRFKHSLHFSFRF